MRLIWRFRSYSLVHVFQRSIQVFDNTFSHRNMFCNFRSVRQWRHRRTGGGDCHSVNFGLDVFGELRCFYFLSGGYVPIFVRFFRRNKVLPFFLGLFGFFLCFPDRFGGFLLHLRVLHFFLQDDLMNRLTYIVQPTFKTI